MSQYVYIKAGRGDPATVGFYDPDGKWHPESDHDTNELAAQRVAWLNGSQMPEFLSQALNSGDGVYRP